MNDALPELVKLAGWLIVLAMSIVMVIYMVRRL